MKLALLAVLSALVVAYVLGREIERDRINRLLP